MLPFEDRKRLASGFEIDACFVPRVFAVSAAIDEQVQHRAVGEVCGGFGLCFCNVAITIVSANCVQVRTGKIVAVFYSAIIVANDFANTRTIRDRDRSNVVAIGDRASVMTHNAPANFDKLGATNCTNIIAVDDFCIVDVKASNTANNIGSVAGNAAMVAAIFNRSIRSVAHNAADDVLNIAGGYVTGHCQVFDRAVFYSTEQTGILEVARNVQTGNGVAVAVKCALIVNLISFGKVSDGRPRFVIQINGCCQHSTRATVLRLAVGAIDNIPESLQLFGGADLIGVALRAAAGHRGVKCAAGDGTAAGDCAVKNAAGDGSIVDDLAVECAAFDGAAGGNGHFAIEHSPAGACNGTGTVFCISQHDVAFNRAAVGVKNPIARYLRADDV